MHRAQLLIDDWQYEALKSMSEREGRSISELLREILAKHLGEGHKVSRKGLARIEGIGNDPKASGRAHDRILYGVNRRS
ncbi:MAG: CopG family transcriptional regulator [Nitrospirota bacterium]|nr:CopG family transcriptional regulator [Nitrospirota bacterium]